MISESLRRLPLFAELPEADLEWLSARAEQMVIAPGASLIEEGEQGDAAYVVLEGEFEVVKKSGRQDIVIAVREAGEVFGEMALIDQSPRSATVRAVRGGKVVRISGETFKQLLEHSSSASLVTLQTIIRRLRQNEALLRQNEKMAALGTLSAGLAHELNNPAAAVRRSADQMKAALSTWGGATNDLQRVALQDEQMQRIEGLRARMEAPRTAAAPDPLTLSDTEYELQNLLEQQGLPNAWEVVPPLVAAGWDVKTIAGLEQSFGSEAFPAVVRWLSAGLAVYSLLDEVTIGAERVSEIVKAVKAYSYLDQGPVQQVDVHEGLENTLIILRHKLSGMQIVREYAADLPRIEAHGSELNQVWTNILDNAAFAMGGKGTIRLKTHAEGEEIGVEIEDDGPGIPEEILQRIFEPFFTTKPPGVGTGLGLHIVYTIINNHNGRIMVTSRPGSTCFQITLPTQINH